MAVSEFAWEQGVSVVPTMVLVAPDGTELDRWDGYASEADLRVAFDSNL